MSSNSTEAFVPSLVGGIPDQHDLVPSILFSVAYFFSLFPFIYHFLKKDTKTVTLAINTFAFSVEQIAAFGLRASQAHVHHPGDTFSTGLFSYLQASYGLGYMAFAEDSVNFMRAVLVNATLADPASGRVDKPQQRNWSRGVSNIYPLLYLIATIMGIIVSCDVPGSAESKAKADYVYNLRYISTGLHFALVASFIAGCLYAIRKVEHIDKKAVLIVVGICSGTCVISIYRLIALRNRTSILNVLPMPPSPLYPAGSLSSPRAKALFYAFQSLPELLIAWFIQTLNLRAAFNTGAFGDWRGGDRRFGIPQLRVRGVHVEGVGIKPVNTLMTSRWLSWMTRGRKSEHRRQS